MVLPFHIGDGVRPIKENEMPITIDGNDIQKVIEAIKKLPVKCDDFNTADKWVGIILFLEALLQTEEPKAEAETLAEGE